MKEDKKKLSRIELILTIGERMSTWERERKDLISSAIHVCIMREYVISEIKRHYTFQSLFAFDANEDIRFICSNSPQVQGLLYF